MSPHNTLTHLCALLSTENGWALAPAEDGSVSFQTAAGMTVTLSPLVANVPDYSNASDASDAERTPSSEPASSLDSEGVRFICDTGVIATAMPAETLRDVLLFNFVLTNTMGGGLSLHPERGAIVLSMALSTSHTTDSAHDAVADTESAMTILTALLAIVRVANEIRETLVRGQSLCAIVPPALAGISGSASPVALANRV